MNPELYGINQAQIKAINDYGLVGYVQRGGELPSSDFIDAYYQHLKTFYARNKLTLNLNCAYRGEPAIRVHNLTDSQVLIFRADTKQLHLQKHHNIFYYLKNMNKDYNKEKDYELLKY